MYPSILEFTRDVFAYRQTSFPIEHTFLQVISFSFPATYISDVFKLPESAVPSRDEAISFHLAGLKSYYSAVLKKSS
jgi:hypothetical protein